MSGLTAPCRSCGGTKRIRVSKGDSEDCPDCAPKDASKRKFTIVYDLRLGHLKLTGEFEKKPTDEEAAAYLEGISGADLCGQALDPPEVEIVDVYEGES